MNEQDTSVVDYQESAQDDAVQASDEPQAFSQLLEEKPEEQNSQDGGDDSGERVSGGIRGRLLASENKGYERGKQEAQAAWEQEKAKYEERLARLEEIEIKQEARELAAKEKVSEALAERLIRAERGKPAPQITEEQPKAQERPRDAQGRFVSTQQNSADARAQELMTQAQNIQRMTGQNVLDVFNSDESVRRRVASGEIDFYDLAREMSQATNDRRRVPPVVPRTTGGTHTSTVQDLTDDQFDRLDRNLQNGVVYDMRR